MTDHDEKSPREPDEAAETPESEDAPAAATWAGRQRSSSEDAGEHAQLSDEAGGEPEDEEAQDEPEDADTEEEGGSDTEERIAQDTVEADTLSLGDREAAREAALAGLRARAAENKAKHGTGAITSPPPKTPPPAAAPAEADGKGEQPPSEPQAVAAVAAAEDEGPPRRRGIWARFAVGSLLIIVAMATATALSLFFFLNGVLHGFHGFQGVENELAVANPGAPQTILVLGSDKRPGEAGKEFGARSDTTILVRIASDQITVLSIPRDLKVNIPGHGIDKFNAAYSIGGAGLTVKTVKQLTGVQDINHVVNVDFTGFADAVNSIGCVYVDVDQHYYHSNVGLAPSEQYAEIDIPAGYQRMCGYNALQYVRYRHDDNDLVRSARQQEFLREMRQELPAGQILNDYDELKSILQKYVTLDIQKPGDLIALAQLVVAANGAPVVQVHFPANLGGPTATYVTYSKPALRAAVAKFEGQTPTTIPGTSTTTSSSKGKSGGGPAGGSGSGGSSGTRAPPAPTLIDASSSGQQVAAQLANAKAKDGKPLVNFPIYYPTKLIPGSTISSRLDARPVSRVPDRRPGQRRLPRVQVRGLGADRRLHGVLRDVGHGLAGPADPRPPGRDQDDRRHRLPALVGRPATAADRVEDRPRLVLDRQHAAERADARSDVCHRRVDAEVHRLVTSTNERQIGVIGVGWVGLVTAACFAEMGHEVVAMDINAEKIRSLGRRQSPIHEPGIDELLERNADRLIFTTAMEDVLQSARLLFCCVDTPPTYSGDADLSRVQAVVSQLADDGDHALVMKSTVPSGTGRAIRRDAPDIAYVSCPEFLKEGTAVDDFLHPDRVVIGADAGAEWAADEIEAVYRPLGGEMVRTDVASAEMIKLAANAFLATKISFINEIANVCEEVGADVTEVARGMGLDKRIGPSFLRAGVGYGGSCLVGDETVLARSNGESTLITLRALFERLEPYGDVQRTDDGTDVIRIEDLELLSWRPNSDRPEYVRVEALTRRRFQGDLCEVRTKMGRRVRCTPDHPFVVADADGRSIGVRPADQLTSTDWLPIAQGAPSGGFDTEDSMSLESSRVHAGVVANEVIVRPSSSEVARLRALPVAQRRRALAGHHRGHVQRFHDIARAGALRLPEAKRLGLSLTDSTAGTARNGTYVPAAITADERFWRVMGLYIAEGHCSRDGQRQRLQWSFHPSREMHLVEEVASYWRDQGVKATVRTMSTTTCVTISSRLLAGWWCGCLGLGRNCYEQRIPDLVWGQSLDAKRALLAGLWLGDGSWSFVNAGPSVILEYGTASRELADGILRLLAEFQVLASLRVGRTGKSTCDAYWIRISGADQVESMLELVDQGDRPAIRESIDRLAKRIAPTGYRRRSDAAWTRVTEVRRQSFDGEVFSAEVPETETFVTTGSLVVHNCFPKDVSALKQLAGNTGYHFQLLTAVIEVNELQKRRVIGKLQKHLGSLAGRTIALLGLAFKPDTDDMREASSLVLAARLQGEGAKVRGYDPVAERRATELLPTVELFASAEQALEGADAAVIVTEWPEFAELDWESLRDRMANPLVVDGRNFLDARRLRNAGFAYEGIGLANGDPEAERTAESAEASSR